ncbi:PadR family transcriptional regulator [Microbacterium sp. JZ70]
MSKLNLLDSVLLGLIARTPSAGFDIRRHLEKTGRVYGYVPQPSQIYRQLASLVQRGLLEFEIDTTRNGPDAKVYSLTPAGLRRFARWADEPFVPAERPLDAHFQLHFALAGALSPVLALRFVEIELEYRVAQESSWEPDHLFPPVSNALFDQDWLDEAAYLGDVRGNFLASAHISWLHTTRRRLLRYIERTGAVWPSAEWSAIIDGDG